MTEPGGGPSTPRRPPSAHDESGLWAAYNLKQMSRPVRDLCADVLALAGPGAGRTAVDIGAGAGKEVRAMLDAGFDVVALDVDPASRDYVRESAGPHVDRVTLMTADLADVEALPDADLIYSSYSLQYVDPARFDRAWAVMRACLRPGGWLAVNVLGDHDDFASDPQVVTLSPERARALFDGLEVVRWHEEDFDGDSFCGPHHWHWYDVFARRPGGPTTVSRE